MKCICNQYDFDEKSDLYQDYWMFCKSIYMGKLYRCIYCGALWVEYTAGHGWFEYYKKKPDSVFKEPSPSIRQEWNISLNENMINTWKNIVAMIPKEAECKIEGVIIPSDIMSFLKFIYKDKKEINRWIYTFRDKTTQFITPINLLKEEGGMDAIRFLLLRIFQSDEIC